MVKRVQIVGHIASALASFTGRIRELTVNLTSNALVVHDGSTPGGHEMARKDLANVAQGPGSGINADLLDNVQGSGYVPITRQVIAGTALNGGGALSTNVTLDVDVGTTENKIPQIGPNDLLPTSIIPYDAGGAEQITDADGIALSVDSKKNIYINMTAAGQNVTLPDATTIPALGGRYVLFNNGEFSWNLRNHTDGKLLASVRPQHAVQISLIDNATAPGLWNCFVEGGNVGVFGTPVVVTGNETLNGNQQLHVINLDLNKYAIIYATSSALKAIIATITGNVVTYGAAATIVAASKTRVRACKVNTNKFAVLFDDTGASDIHCVICSVSGTTITVGADSELVAGKTGHECVFYGVNDKFFVAYRTSTTDVHYVIVTVSGTTFTVQTPLTVTTTINSVSVLQYLSATRVVSFEFDGVNTNLRTLTISTNTVTDAAISTSSIFGTIRVAARLDDNAFYAEGTVGSANRARFEELSPRFSGYGLGTIPHIRAIQLDKGHMILLIDLIGIAIYMVNMYENVYGKQCINNLPFTSTSDLFRIDVDQAAFKALLAYRDTNNSDFVTCVALEVSQFFSDAGA